MKTHEIRKHMDLLSEQNLSNGTINIMYNQSVRKWVNELTGVDSLKGIPHEWKNDSGQVYPSILIPTPNGISLQKFKQAFAELRQEGFQLMPGQNEGGQSFLGIVYMGQ